MRHVLAACLVFALGATAAAQTPTGAIAGTVVDSHGARVGGAQIVVRARSTGEHRSMGANEHGLFDIVALAPARYDVTIEAHGFQRLSQEVIVEAGTTTTLHVVLPPTTVSQTLTVVAIQPLLRHDDHVVAGVVRRDRIESLPLNGRNFLDLARLEPGVGAIVRAAGNRLFVASLGAGLQSIPRIGWTRTMVDGGSVNGVGAIGTALQLSQDAVQEFQLATINFEPATGLTSNAAINVVTRSGGNSWHGSAFAFYRDHHLAAYPALRRDPSTDPFFRRLQAGAAAGGRVIRDRAFFFGVYERSEQDGVVSVQPIGGFERLGGVFRTPATGHLATVRIDLHLGAGHRLFVRDSLDRNHAFAPAGTGITSLPSGWSRLDNDAEQRIAALTTVLSPRLVNELRVSKFVLDAAQAAAGDDDCAGCIGIDGPRITVAGAGVALGPSAAMTFDASRWQIADGLTWQRGRHTLRAGFEWERSRSISTLVQPTQLMLWSPTAAATVVSDLPSMFTSSADVLRLPLQTFSAGIGPPGIPERDGRPARVTNLYRGYVADTWRIGDRVTVNGSIASSYEPDALNHDLSKPAWLAPLLAGRTQAPGVPPPTLAARAGFAWTATADARTVVRGGAGRFYDPLGTTNSANLANERLLLAPLGTARITVTGQQILLDGMPIHYPNAPTSFTGAQLLPLLPSKLQEFQRALDDARVQSGAVTIDFVKAGQGLYDPDYAVPNAIHGSLGVQRALSRTFVVSADAVWRRFVHTFVNGIDFNRFVPRRGGILPLCTPAQRNDVGARCTNGSINFDTTIGRARYRGLLIRADTRSERAQVTTSYALGSFVGSNGATTATAEQAGGRAFGFNNNHWFENVGPLPTDLRHIANVAGFVDLPWRLRIAFNASASSRPPYSAWVEGVDYNGDGTQNDLLPDTTINAFGRGLDRRDLARLVDRYNNERAGRTLPNGDPAPVIALPQRYAFDDNFVNVDVRLTRTVRIRRATAALFVEVFNALNTANLVGFSGNLRSATFGAPSARFSQVFGSGGPRAFQLGARITFQ